MTSVFLVLLWSVLHGSLPEPTLIYRHLDSTMVSFAKGAAKWRYLWRKNWSHIKKIAGEVRNRNRGLESVVCAKYINCLSNLADTSLVSDTIHASNTTNWASLPLFSEMAQLTDTQYFIVLGKKQQHKSTWCQKAQGRWQLTSAVYNSVTVNNGQTAWSLEFLKGRLGIKFPFP